MTDERSMKVPAKKRWAYAYQIIPPQPEDRLKAVRDLIDQETRQARKAARTWQGRFIPEKLITHILVVSDSPDQEAEANHRLEAALTELQTGFVRTAPLPVDEDVDLSPGASKLPPMLAPLVAPPVAEPVDVP